jgi:hypothetical protein
MKKLAYNLCLLICSLLAFNSYAQKIGGEWNGIITQEEGGLASQYYFSLFIVQNGENITGFTKVELYKDKKRVFFARKKIIGTFKDKTLFFKEIEIVEEEMYTMSNICLIQAKLKFTWDKSALCFKGTWGGLTKDGTSCAPGKIKVCSTIPIASN